MNQRAGQRCKTGDAVCGGHRGLIGLLGRPAGAVLGAAAGAATGRVAADKIDQGFSEKWRRSTVGIAYVVDLALPVKDGRLPVTFGDRPGPAAGLCFEAEAQLEACLRETQARLRIY